VLEVLQGHERVPQGGELRRLERALALHGEHQVLRFEGLTCLVGELHRQRPVRQDGVYVGVYPDLEGEVPEEHGDGRGDSEDNPGPFLRHARESVNKRILHATVSYLELKSVSQDHDRARRRAVSTCAHGGKVPRCGGRMVAAARAMRRRAEARERCAASCVARGVARIRRTACLTPPGSDGAELAQPLERMLHLGIRHVGGAGRDPAAAAHAEPLGLGFPQSVVPHDLHRPAATEGTRSLRDPRRWSSRRLYPGTRGQRSTMLAPCESRRLRFAMMGSRG